MQLGTRLFTIILVSVSCVGCDQAAKFVASEHLPKNGMDSYFYDLVRLGYVENSGAFLGLGDSLSNELRFGIFVVSVGVLLLGLLFYLITNSKLNFYSVVALSLLFSGGISNFYDRLTNNGVVVDFLNVGFGLIRTGIFNVADMAILAGMLVFWLDENKQNSAD